MPEPACEEFLIDHLSVFERNRADELAQLIVAVGNRDYEQLHQICHSWSGMCAPYGFTNLGKVATKIDALAEAHDWSTIEALLPKIADYLERKRMRSH